MYVDKVWESTLSDGVAGTRQTLAQMAALVRRDSRDLLVRDEAARIVSHCPGHDFDCEIDALFYHVRDRITYRRDPVNQERVQDARRTLFLFESGDCDDKVVALATLLGTLGHRSRFKIVGARPSNFTHVYLEVATRGGAWLALDPTPEQAPPGWEARGHASTYEIFTQQKTKPGPGAILTLAVLAYFILRGN